MTAYACVVTNTSIYVTATHGSESGSLCTPQLTGDIHVAALSECQKGDRHLPPDGTDRLTTTASEPSIGDTARMS